MSTLQRVSARVGLEQRTLDLRELSVAHGETFSIGPFEFKPGYVGGIAALRVTEHFRVELQGFLNIVHFTIFDGSRYCTPLSFDNRFDFSSREADGVPVQKAVEVLKHYIDAAKYLEKLAATFHEVHTFDISKSKTPKFNQQYSRYEGNALSRFDYESDDDVRIAFLLEGKITAVRYLANGGYGNIEEDRFDPFEFQHAKHLVALAQRIL
jgi:hypothetical protein